ncbi:MAG: hypothetical protein KAS64_11715 [Spirochaetes bacterium]|nr:hypothetical protein [Spirochaetota bacterium]
MKIKKEIRLTHFLIPIFIYSFAIYAALRLSSVQASSTQTGSTSSLTTDSTNLKHKKSSPVKKFPFYLYSDYGSPYKMHYIPSGYMGDIFSLSLVGNHRTNPNSGKSCIRVSYYPKNKTKTPSSWAGIYWLNPPNNWAFLPKAGYNLSAAKKFVFHARGNTGKEVVTFMVGGIRGKYPDSDSSQVLIVNLTKKWKVYKIPLTGIDMSYIIGGFVFILKEKLNLKGAVFYLDEMYYSD